MKNKNGGNSVKVRCILFFSIFYLLVTHSNYINTYFSNTAVENYQFVNFGE